LLQKALALANTRPVPLSSIDLDVWSLNELVVQREWQNIDLLLLDEPHRLAVIVENKIVSGEHSNQLERVTIRVFVSDSWTAVASLHTPLFERSQRCPSCARRYE
jgi:hypothetical protein